jgi:hypothetical protein
MKKFFLVTLVSCTSFFNLCRADEGMYLPYILGTKVYNNMVKNGLKLTKEQLYSINKSSIKDAIVLFGRGCTAEIVSKEGLLFTNHHCGYNNIAEASSVAHNYLQDGFWAKTKQEEIACPGLSVLFLEKAEDVTNIVNAKLKDLNPNEISSKLPAILMELSNEASKQSGKEVKINSFYKGNQFIQFTYVKYTDVRLVGAPPESIGKFGGDTDNWEWPRHTGDFSIFRVYMSKDGKPADYSAENVPFKPKHFLPVSIKGVKNGDYAMIFGYPGGTNRYETSYGLNLKVDIENPNLVELRDARLKFMHTEMIKDPAVKLKLASNYAYVANYWKFFDGESKQIIKNNVIERKQKDEAAFELWAKGKKEYENIFTNIKATYDNWKPYTKHRVYINEGILGSPILAMANSLNALQNALTKNNANQIKEQTEKVKVLFKAYYDAHDIPSDKNIVAAMIQMFYKNIDPSQRPENFYTNLKTYGNIDSDETYTKFANALFNNSILVDEAKFNSFISKPDSTILKNDLAFQTATAFVNNYVTNYAKYFVEFNNKLNTYSQLYLKGILEMNANNDVLYPDANQTMRVSYGNVKSYSPKDGTVCKEVCTATGILEKYKPGDYEFDAPKKLIELIKAKDFGQYADKQTKDLVVGFISNNDITGGNSGSPVLNAKGELIGLAFDGNYEALSHKIAVDKDLNRTISLDIRYMLFVIEKLGGATNLINELQLVKQ